MWSQEIERGLQDASSGAQSADGVGRQQLLDAMAERHPLPGYYPVVVVALAGEAFRMSMLAHLEASTLVGEVRLTERRSSRGTYISYHLDLWVENAEAALGAKEALALLDGVRALL